MTTLHIGLGLFGCFCNFAYLKESVLGKHRCSSGQHAFKPHLQDLQWMQFRTTNLNIFLAARLRQDHVCSEADPSLPSQLLPSSPNTLPEQHQRRDTLTHGLPNSLHPSCSEQGTQSILLILSPPPALWDRRAGNHHQGTDQLRSKEL